MHHAKYKLNAFIVSHPTVLQYINISWRVQLSQEKIKVKFVMYLQGGREISAIIVPDDYLCYKEPKSPYIFFSYFNIQRGI